MSLMESAVERLEELSLWLTMSWNCACLAEALAIRGRSGPAERLARRSLERVKLGDRIGEVMAHRALAMAAVLRSRPDRDAAHENLVRADEAANRAGERERAITAYWRAELWRDLGDSDGAVEAVQLALPVFERMGMEWYEQRARALRGSG